MEDQFWLTDQGQHWAQKVQEEHERASGRPVGSIASNTGKASASTSGSSRVSFTSDRHQNARRYLESVGENLQISTSPDEDGLQLRALCPSESSARKIYNVVVPATGFANDFYCFAMKRSDATKWQAPIVC